ncbi:DNA recombination protein RmuC [Stakelama marina]|uniref:DNA recombination protein RmuC homolog n=1 Tax=Stakelama marina TaxID=2826939 RepID=A0A8T4IB54_9SPHN|nr:DNA recombination protein RmuC [Stakelama marina]MBR0551643.1 DNA recombination protein RmuC [Stakelama marina]
MDSVAVVLILVAIVLGVLIGWFLGSRGTAQARAERDARAEEFKAAIADLARAQEQAAEAGELRNAAERFREERDAARIESTKLRTRLEAEDERLKEFVGAREAMAGQFREVANNLLGEAQKSFLSRASDRFTEEGKANEAKLKALLSPVQDVLKRYEEGLQRVEKERVDSYAGLREAVELVRAGQTQVKEEAARLVNVLRASPKARGRWGEQSLRNVLEQAGLSPFADFQSEVSVDGAEGRLRPDVVVRLPGGRQLIVDAKCSLNAYLDAADAVDDAGRASALRSHASAIRTHAQQLGSKAYWSEFGDSADYVVMYIPGEQFLFAALEQDPELWEWAIERRVLLATPTNLVAIAKTVANIWRQEKLVEDARKVDALGKELHDRLATAASHLKRVGGGLNSAVENYNKFIASFDGRVLVSARRFRELNVDVGNKEIEEIEPVDAVARAPVGELPAPAPSDDAEAAE